MSFSDVQQSQRRCFLLLVLAGALALVGCGDDGKAVVKGRVTLDGEPVPNGIVQFFPEDKKSPSGKPGIIENGTYTASGVPIGKVRVVVNSSQVVGKKKADEKPESPMVDVHKEMIPAKYHSPSILVKEIKPGANEINLELTTK